LVKGVRLVFADERLHRLCSEPSRAAAFWGAGWATLIICLALLADSVDFAHLRKWHALDVRVTGGRVRVAHRDAVVTLIAITEDGVALDLKQEEAMTALDPVRTAQVVDVACGRKSAPTRRGR
jgi:hypothetical protein